MKRKRRLLFIVISVILSTICMKDNRVYAFKERSCLGDGCPQDIVSHYDYTDVYDLGIKYVISDYFTFEYDYYIKTFVNYSNGLLTSVSAPIVTHGDEFWAQASDYNVSISSSYNYTINSAKTSAFVTLTLVFTFTGQIPSYIVSDPVVIRYTVS